MYNYRYFFWDFDGMLFDTYFHSTNSFIQMIQEKRNSTLNPKEVYDALKISYGEAFKRFEVNEDERARFVEIADASLAGFPYPPIEKILKTICEEGKQNFIFTNRNELTIAYLKKYHMDQYFTDFILASDLPFKPHPDSLNAMIEKHQLNKKECVVLGDRSIDVDAAYNAGVDGILYDVDSRVFQHHATYVIKHHAEIYNFLDLTYHQLNNYHTHTSRCGHAIGKDEEYVIEAIRQGYQTLGFSDHVMIPDLTRNDEYFDSIRLLKEKYKNQINIKVALECEYYPPYISYYKKIKENGSVDYLIFGNHGVLKPGSNSRQDQYNFIRDFTEDWMLDLYYDTLKEAIDSKLFKYICHPDCFLRGYRKWNDKTIALTHKIAKLFHNKDLYAELSCSNMRSNAKMVYNGEEVACYPFKEFFKILNEYNIKFVVGCDAHAPSQLNDEALQKVLSMAKELKLNLVYEIKDL